MIVYVCIVWLVKVSDLWKFNIIFFVYGVKKYLCFYKKKFLIFGMMIREMYSFVNESE